MSKLYCPECGEYLMAGDGECHDCHCGWKQYVPRKVECEGCGAERHPDTAFCEFCDHITTDN
jgi:hypothetical protein